MPSVRLADFLLFSRSQISRGGFPGENSLANFSETTPPAGFPLVK
jgi:hypothetical protein